MKLAEKTVDIQSNIQFDESVAVSIDESAVSMVIERLISTYSNPYRAALREYSSNAYDEHIAAGQKAPVEVSLPSALSPVLKIQDFGRGLTREELKGFGTIGTSTKRGSNEFTGGFGLGSKTGLAAASQFTVVSVKNGRRNTVIVARDEHNVPHMNFLAEAETDDDSGTTIIVPISDINKFGNLEDFFVGWERGTILVDGEEPRRSVHDPNNFQSLGGGIVYNDKLNVSSGQNTVRIVINQVYYTLDYRTLGLNHTQWNLLKYKIIRIDNGSVDIAPSREDLLYNARTKAALAARFDEVMSISARDMIEEVASADSLHEALSRRDRMRASGFPIDSLKWNGKGLTLPGVTVKGNKVPNPEGTWVSPVRDSGTKSGYRVEKQWAGLNRTEPWRAKTNPLYRFMIVYGASTEERYGTRGRRAHREAGYVADYLNSIDKNREYKWDIFIVGQPVDRINRIYRDLADAVVSSEDFMSIASAQRAATRAEDKKASDKKTTHEFVVYNGHSYAHGHVVKLSVADIKSTFDRIVVLRNQSPVMLDNAVRDLLTTKKHYNSSRVQSIHLLRKKYNVGILYVGKNDDLTEYTSSLPPIVSIEALAAEAVKEATTDKTKLELMAKRDISQYSTYIISRLSSSDISQIKRKKTREWAEAIRTFKDDSSSVLSTFEWMVRYYTDKNGPLAQAVNSVQESGKSVKLPDSPMERYPLLEYVSTYNYKTKHVIDYINMADAATKA